jgi:tRNA pseudouridine38-40 synthase
MAEVPAQFDARRTAIRRTYTYRLVLGPPASGILVRQRAGVFAGRHDIHAMAQAAAIFIGYHDFAGFRNSDCNATRTDLTLETSSLVPLSDDSRIALSIPPEADALIYTIACRSFLMHMVRRIVGSLVLVGRGKLSLDEIRHSLRTGTTPARTLLAPAAGLVLHRVDYPEDPFHLPDSQP